MSPTLPRLNTTDGVLPNTVFSRYFSLKAGICANCPHLRFGQFGRSAAFATIGRSVLDTIQLVVACRVPTQIFKPIVKWVAVVMTAFHSLRARANKRGQNKRVWLKNLKFIVFPQSQKRAVVKFIGSKHFNFPSFCGANAPMIGHFVKPFVTFNGKPSFHVSPHIGHTGNIP